MSFCATYDISEKAKELYIVVEPEISNLKTKRASVTISETKDSCRFEVNGQDFTSFRAMNNAVIRMITVFNKIGGI